MIDFSTLQGMTIPEGVVTQIAKDGVVLWKSGPNYECIYDFGTITTKLTFGFNRYAINGFSLDFDPSECNAFMVNGVLYEVVTEISDNGNFIVRFPEAISTLTGEKNPYSISFTASSSNLVIYSYKAGTYEISIGRLN